MIDTRTRILLSSRVKRLPRTANKLAEIGQYGLDVMFPEQVEFDEDRMSLVIPFADGNNRDGVGDLLEVGGINVERHVKNPIVLFDHGKSVSLPIALAEDRDTKEYTVFIDPIARQATLNAFFYQGTSAEQQNLEERGVLRADGPLSDHALFCEQLFDLAVKRYLRAGSIGYQVIAAKNLQPDYERGIPAGLHLLSVLMLEGSLVVLPANMDTVRKMLALPQCCGKPLSPYLIKSLQPYAPANKAVMGWEAKAIQEIEEECGQPMKAIRMKYGRKKTIEKKRKSLDKQKTLEIRKKYRPIKHLRRKLKSSTNGAAVLYIGDKDIASAKKAAEDKGLEWHHLGSNEGVSRIKLIGADNGIDCVAKLFGRSKSLNTKVKNMPENMDRKSVDGTTEDAQEPYDAQVVRQLHGDAKLLMEDYDKHMPMLMDETTEKHLTNHLGYLSKFLDDTEKMWSKHKKFKDLPALEGAMEHEEEEEDENEEEENIGKIGGKDDEETAVEEDSAEEEEPTLDEAMEGTERGEKSLRSKWGKKSSSGRKKSTPCTKCAKKMKVKKKDLTEAEEDKLESDLENVESDIEEDEEKALEPHEHHHVGEAAEYAKELSEKQDFTDEDRMKSYHFHKALDAIPGVGMDSMPDDEMQEKALKIEYHKPSPGENQMLKVRIVGYLPNGTFIDIPFADKQEAEMYAKERNWQYTKAMPSSGISPEKARQILKDGEANGHPLTDKQRRMFGAAAGKDKAMPGTEEWAEEEMEEPEHQEKGMHRSNIGEASKFFKALSTERAFGEPHRQEALHHHKMLTEAHKALDPIAEAGQETTDEEEMLGEIDQKKLQGLKSLLLKQHEAQQNARKELNRLASKVR
jgi:hypothetical protein